MRFNPLKTRRGKLKQKITQELSKSNPDVDKILEAVEYYEKNNLKTITKLKRNKRYTTKRISGALRQSIKAHGPIESKHIGSATKRIFGSLLDERGKYSASKMYFILMMVTIYVYILHLMIVTFIK